MHHRSIKSIKLLVSAPGVSGVSSDYEDIRSAGSLRVAPSVNEATRRLFRWSHSLEPFISIVPGFL